MSEIVDQWGRPFKSTARPEREEIAVSIIRDRYFPYVSQGMKPADIASIFKEADQGYIFRQMELFAEMEEKDAHLVSIMQTRKLSVSGLGWDVTAASDSAEDKKIADDVREQLNALEDFEDNIHHWMDAVGKGFAPAEIMWETGPKFRIAGIRNRLQRRFTYYNPDFNEGVLEVPRLITMDEPVYGVELPPWKFVIHEYRAKAGTVPKSSLFRVLTWLYIFKNYTLKDWVTFCEVYGMPLRLGKYEPSTSQADKDALIKAVTMLGTDAAGIISKSTEIEFVETAKGTQGADVFKLFADFCNSEMSKAVLGQTLTSGTGEKHGGASLALGKVHDQVRQDIIKADARALSRTIKGQLIRPYVGFNYGWDVPLPGFRLIVEDAKDLVSQIKVDAAAQKMGYPLTERYMRDTYGYIENDSKDVVMKPIGGGATVEDGGDGEGGAFKQSLKKNCLTSSRK